MRRIPRKIKKQIPLGLYCYTPVEFPNEKNGWVYKIKPCPFYEFKTIHDYGEKYRIGWCKLIKCEIDDQCKSCGWKNLK